MAAMADQQHHHTAVVHPTQQYVVLGQPPINAVTDDKSKVMYSKENVNSVKWLVIMQLIFSIIMIIFQVVTTAMDDSFRFRKAKLEQYDDFYNWSSFSDHAATGIWVGLLIALTAVIGLFGVKQQRKALIITPLVLNILCFMANGAVIGTTSSTIGILKYCHDNGEEYRSEYKYFEDYEDTTLMFSTTEEWKHPPVEFFGETLSGRKGLFHCTATYFRVWKGMEVVILISAVAEFFIIFSIFIYNCIAACTPCCCFRQPQPVQTIVYYNNPPPGMIASNHTTVPSNGAPPVGPVTYPVSQTAFGYPTTMPHHTGQAPSNLPPVNYPNPPNYAGGNVQDEKSGELPPSYSSMT